MQNRAHLSSPAAVASLGFAVIFSVVAGQARASGGDFGPLKDVLAVRAAFGERDPDLTSVRVCGDWADVYISFKGAMENVVRRSQGWKFEFDPKKNVLVAGAYDLKGAPASVRACFANVVIPK